MHSREITHRNKHFINGLESSKGLFSMKISESNTLNDEQINQAIPKIVKQH